MPEDPQKIIAEIRYATGLSRWMNGDCFRLYLILKAIYPDAEAYYDGGHVFTKIDGCFYDIRGFYAGDISKLYLMENEPRIWRDAHEWRSDNYNPKDR